MLRIFLSIESRVYREGLSMLLRSNGNLTVIETSASLEQTGANITKLDPDVIIVDAAVCANGADCCETVKSAFHLSEGRPIIVLGHSDQDEDILASLEAGAAGCVTHDQSVEELVAVVTAAAGGEMRCPPRIAYKMQQRLTQLADIQNQIDKLKRLSQQEHFILGLLDQRMSNKQIARHLGLELSTIKNHVHNILVKLHVSSRTEAAALMSVSASTMGMNDLQDAHATP